MHYVCTDPRGGASHQSRGRLILLSVQSRPYAWFVHCSQLSALSLGRRLKDNGAENVIAVVQALPPLRALDLRNREYIDLEAGLYDMHGNGLSFSCGAHVMPW